MLLIVISSFRSFTSKLSQKKICHSESETQFLRKKIDYPGTTYRSRCNRFLDSYRPFSLKALDLLYHGSSCFPLFHKIYDLPTFSYSRASFYQIFSPSFRLGSQIKTFFADIEERMAH